MDPTAAGRGLFAQVRGDLARGDVAAAREKLEEARLFDFTATADRAELMCLTGETALAAGDLDAAQGAFEGAMKLDERSLRPIKGLGAVALTGHANEEAMAFFKRALSLAPDDVDATMGIGLVYRRLGLLDEAIFWLEKTALRGEAPKAALTALAQSCGQLNQPRRAIEILARVLDAVGDEHALLVTLGQLYLDQGMIEEGKAILAKALVGTTSSAA
jgi:tetratricopeptide (TPR) repeat protein